MSWLPSPLHPAVVHFPVALSIVAVVLDAAARHPRLRSLDPAGPVLIVMAAVGAVAAVLTGDAAGDAAVVPAGAAALLDRHGDIGELAMWLLLAVAALRLVAAARGWFRGWVPWAYLAVAAAAAVVVGYNARLGGEMVFGHGLGTAPVQRAPAPSVASPGAPVQRRGGG